MLTPRGGGSASPRKAPIAVNLQDYQRKRFETLTIHGSLTQEVIQSVLSILKNATTCGQTHARVQTLHLAKDYTYSRRQPPDKDAHVIHDMLTLQPYGGTSTRIHLAARPRELVEWLIGEQKVRVIVATCCMSEARSFGEPTFASFMHLYAVLVPEKQAGGGVWNAVFLKKSLDASMVQGWNDRCLAALRIGASYFSVCVLYRGSDFSAAGGDTKGVPEELKCIQPRQHLTMVPHEKDPHWVLNEKCSTLVTWVDQAGYRWTIATEAYVSEETKEVVHSIWGFFVVLLQPLS